MKILLALCLLFTMGCETRWWDNVADWSHRPGQDEATAMLWSDYAVDGFVTKREPPVVGWIDKPDCSYVGSTGINWSGFEDNDDLCVQGDTYPTDWTIIMLSEPTMWQTTIAHEMCHGASYAATGDGDPDHKGPCFTSGGYVDVENAKLKEMDL